MAKHKYPKPWVGIWVDSWLDGSIPVELTLEQEALWLRLLLFASKKYGYIQHNETVGYTAQELAGRLRTEPDKLSETISTCIKHKKITKLGDGRYYITNWDKYTLGDGYYKKR